MKPFSLFKRMARLDSALPLALALTLFLSLALLPLASSQAAAKGIEFSIAPLGGIAGDPEVAFYVTNSSSLGVGTHSYSDNNNAVSSSNSVRATHLFWRMFFSGSEAWFMKLGYWKYDATLGTNTGSGGTTSFALGYDWTWSPLFVDVGYTWLGGNGTVTVNNTDLKTGGGGGVFARVGLAF